MSKDEQIHVLLGFIMDSIHACPIDDESGVDFEKECVGLGAPGCADCILRHLDKLRK